ncbi:hydroxyisourate hydrolase [Patulibacter sp. NPDC049589]|uniref:hydroxyisourate hydrolase n=1 Tax=Patulibacter sp. NPDC049589 TaxID=3154731 RepID=UPI00341963AF
MTAISISTHVLDTSKGEPVPGVPVTLERLSAGEWLATDAGTTDADGRVPKLVPEGQVVPAGRYRVRFDLEGAPGGQPGWYPEVSVVIDIAGDSGHHHVPLLLAPFGYTTYRGS